MKSESLSQYVSDVLFVNDRFNAEESRVRDLSCFVITLSKRDQARIQNVELRKVLASEFDSALVKNRYLIVSSHGLPTISIVEHRAGDWSLALTDDSGYTMVCESLRSRVGAFLMAHVVADTMTAHRLACTK